MKKMVSCFFTVLAWSGISFVQASGIVTNPVRWDGFGSQFQTIISTVIYAELTHQEFRYTPFRQMEHNYDNDVDFLKKKELLINFIGNFEVNEDLSIQLAAVDAGAMISCFERHVVAGANSQSLKKIKQVFRMNKNREDYFKDEHFNIAIHIRRPNPHDNRIEGTDVPDGVYLRKINLLRDIYVSKKPRFHIYSQGDTEVFKNRFDADDIVLHINTSTEEAFTSMVMADVLLATTSSFSYVAGLLSDGMVYYIPFWHPPLPHWIELK